MAKPNYSFQKRQKEMERKKKNEEKRLNKLKKRNADAQPDAGQASNDDLTAAQ